jgi:metal-dependent amidase/aminoacylase/carboxypeptidase family protein
MQIIENIKKRLVEEILDVEFKMGDGQCEDYAKYMEKVGERSGFMIATNIITDEVRKLHKEDDEDDEQAA